jgi:hypothetical protein
MDRISFIVVLILILVIINLYSPAEHFDVCKRYDKCSKYDGKSYSQCYNTGECSVMIDLVGNAFCTSK